MISGWSEIRTITADELWLSPAHHRSVEVKRQDVEMRLKACVNGPRKPSEHPALPVTADDLAREVAGVRAAGADAAHVHVKDAEGIDTFAADSLEAVVEGVRSAAPGMPLGVTTGAWALPDPRDRVAAIDEWRLLPDFASVNWHEAGADDVAAALLRRGVGVEAGLWHDEAVAAWGRSPLRQRCLRILLELPDGLDPVGAVEMADRLHRAVRDLSGDALPILLHGEGSSCWPVLRHAAALGMPTRIGLEDTLELPDGSPARGNVELVHRAIEVIDSAKAGR